MFSRKIVRVLNSKPWIVPIVLFGLSLCISIVFSIVFFDGRITRTFFFPDSVTQELRSERRPVPSGKGIQDDIAEYVREIILGPTILQSGRVLPRDTTVRIAIAREGKVYLDLSHHAVTIESPLGIEETIDIVRHNIFFNFRSINSIVVTVAGQKPFEPPYFPASPL
ncbi:MAG: hypothetical protein EA426_07945 [Spirochaetaceae bacterium]|nr:MAG: hypothetical protein EA426_07945 [Spirochaetaceae bacterium]